MQGDAIGNGAHAVLAHAKAQVALLGRVLLEVAELLHQRHVGGRQVGRASPEPCARHAMHREGDHDGRAATSGVLILMILILTDPLTPHLAALRPDT